MRSRGSGRCSSPTPWRRFATCARRSRPGAPEHGRLAAQARQRVHAPGRAGRCRIPRGAGGVRRAALRAGAVLDGQRGHRDGRAEARRYEDIRLARQDLRTRSATTSTMRSRSTWPSARRPRCCACGASASTTSGPGSRPTFAPRWRTSSRTRRRRRRGVDLGRDRPGTALASPEFDLVTRRRLIGSPVATESVRPSLAYEGRERSRRTSRFWSGLAPAEGRGSIPSTRASTSEGNMPSFGRDEVRRVFPLHVATAAPLYSCGREMQGPAEECEVAA